MTNYLVSIQWGIGFYEDHLDEVESALITIDEIEGEEHVMLNGVIESPDGPVLYRSNLSDPDSDVETRDFLLVQTTEHGTEQRLSVNLSRFDTWAQINDDLEEPKPYYDNGDSVLVYGEVREVNGTWVLFGELVWNNAYEEEARAYIDDFHQTFIEGTLFLLMFIIGFYPDPFIKLIKRFENRSKEKDGLKGGSNTKSETSYPVYHLKNNEPQIMIDRAIVNTRYPLYKIGFISSILLLAILITLGWYYIIIMVSHDINKLRPAVLLLPLLVQLAVIVYSPVVIPMIYLMHVSWNGLMRTPRKVELGKNGIVFHRETNEPYYLSWDAFELFHVMSHKIVIRLKDHDQEAKNENGDYSEDASDTIDVEGESGGGGEPGERQKMKRGTISEQEVKEGEMENVEGEKKVTAWRNDYIVKLPKEMAKEIVEVVGNYDLPINDHAELNLLLKHEYDTRTDLTRFLYDSKRGIVKHVRVNEDGLVINIRKEVDSFFIPWEKMEHVFAVTNTLVVIMKKDGKRLEFKIGRKKAKEIAEYFFEHHDPVVISWSKSSYNKN